MIKRFYLLLGFLCALSFSAWAQNNLQKEHGPVVGLKTNALYWATVTPNLGLEFRLAKHWSLDVEAGLNPFTGKNDDGSYGKSIKHIRVHPEPQYSIALKLRINPTRIKNDSREFDFRFSLDL